MSVAFQATRLIPVAVAAADSSDPNTLTTAQTDARTQSLRVRGDGGQLTFGHNLVLVAKDGAAGAGADVAGVTFDVTVWVKDAAAANVGNGATNANNWYSLRPEATVPSRRLLATDDVRNVDVYVQVTAVNAPGATASIICRVVEI
jgi:hypothetical protein